MAQYQRNFYGSSYYGDTNAFCGTYTTDQIVTDEPLNGTFTTTITAVMPDATYLHSDPEFVQVNGTWTVSGAYLRSNSPNARLLFTATCDRIVINYQERPSGPNVNVRITTSAMGEAPSVTTYSFSANNAITSDKTYIVTDLPYGKQEVEIYLDAAPTGLFAIKSIDARVCGITVEARAKTGDAGAWTAFEKIDLTTALIPSRTDHAYTLTGTSANYAGKDRIQLKIWIASSDNDLSPIIEEIINSSGDTNNRTEDGIWNVYLDMGTVATDAGVVFKEIVSLDWDADIPTDTSMTIRSRSSEDDVIWTAWTVPYKQGIKRVRLKENSYNGYLITPLINPASVNAHLSINAWKTWDSICELPPDSSSTKIVYYFLDESKDIVKALHRVDNPRTTVEKSFLQTDVGNKPYYLRIDLQRRVDKSSPVVEFLSLVSEMIYDERFIVEGYEFAAVNNQNSGEQVILDMTTITWDPPAEADDITYYLEDTTGRPVDLVVYYDSEKALPGISKSNQTKLIDDKIWAKVNVDTTPNNGQTTGVLKHYQYGGGSVVYGAPDENKMSTAFSPAVDTNKKYRYFIQNGWYDPATAGIVPGSENTDVEIFWKTEEVVDPRTNLTDKSSHNAILANASDRESDGIVTVVKEASTFQEVEWVSDEKIYSGSCNVNDIKANYKIKHTTPESGDSRDIEGYIVQPDEDTYLKIAQKFQVEESDIRRINNLNDEEQPFAGKIITIPARVVLPRINPLATVGPNPYQIEIVYNSVREGGKIVPEARITKKTLTYTMTEAIVEKEEIIRGPVPNGKDPLHNANVIEILGIWDDFNVQAVSYIPNVHYTLDGNFVSWGLVSTGTEEPDPGASYYVKYKYLKPSVVTVEIGSDYAEESGIDRIWKSDILEFSGTCAPGADFKAELPDFTEWAGTSDPRIDDLEYIIEDNDLWVKTWVEFDNATNKYYAIGSLQDRIPKENWFPYIKTGYYYSGLDEYYLFSEPITVQSGPEDMPLAENVEYIPAKYSNGILLQNASTNKVMNSGFEVAQQGLVQQIIFGSDPTFQGVAELGITR